MTINNSDTALLVLKGDGISGHTITSQPIGELTIPGVGVLTPAEDITPLEVLRVNIMMAIGTIQFSMWDYKGYVAKHNLERHFTHG